MLNLFSSCVSVKTVERRIRASLYALGHDSIVILNHAHAMQNLAAVLPVSLFLKIMESCRGVAMGADDKKNDTEVSKKNDPDVSKHDYDVTEHLMSPAEVASKYATDINAEAPSKSGGLKSSEVRAPVLTTDAEVEDRESGLTSSSIHIPGWIQDPLKSI